MPDHALALTDGAAELVRAVCDSVTSPNTRRAYARALRDFLGWYAAEPRGRLSKAVIQRYVAELREQGLSGANIAQRLAAIRKLAAEAADAGVLSEATAAAIGRVRNVRHSGQRVGNWATKAEAEALLAAPDTSTRRGLRDRAILALLLGCGLRRAELAALTFAHVRQREGRWVLADVLGKGAKVRTVPMPSWAKAALDAWGEAAAIREGAVFRPIAKGGRVGAQGMTAQAVYLAVRRYCGDLRPHDLRRTHARLARLGGAPLEQIALTLGHASVQTTERYLGLALDLADAPCDRLGLRLG